MEGQLRLECSPSLAKRRQTWQSTGAIPVCVSFRSVFYVGRSSVVTSIRQKLLRELASCNH